MGVPLDRTYPKVEVSGISSSQLETYVLVLILCSEWGYFWRE